MKKFKLRAECLADIITFKGSKLPGMIGAWKIENDGEGFPDVTFEFECAYPLNTLREFIEDIDDGINDLHVMAETLAYLEHYTGIRC